MIIIIVLKLDSEVNSRHDPSHGSRGSTQADPGQCKDNVFYYHNFKTQFEGWPRQDTSHGSEGSIRVDPSQHMNKSDYYHSFEAWLRSWPEAVQVTRWEGQPGWPIFFLNNQSNLILTIFFLIIS